MICFENESFYLISRTPFSLFYGENVGTFCISSHSWIFFPDFILVSCNSRRDGIIFSC